jgi:hypothetical protein
LNEVIANVAASSITKNSRSLNIDHVESVVPSPTSHAATGDVREEADYKALANAMWNTAVLKRPVRLHS